MAFEDGEFIDRAQRAEARNSTYQQQIDRLTEKYRDLMDTFCARERSGGDIEIDWGRFVASLEPEQALFLRSEIDRHHRIRGMPGDKPRMSVRA